MTQLDPTLAGDFARIALGHVTKEYPHKLDHVLASDADAVPPRTLHPIFFGSFDWHSCVHGWWTLLTIRRLFPGLPESGAIQELANKSFTRTNVAGELAYLDRPLSRGFERPYGWAWLLQLHLEARLHSEQWAENLRPLADEFSSRLRNYLALLTYPIRVGTHFNSAFALILALPWADEFDPDLSAQIRKKAADWFSEDRDCQAWEPGGDEFLSSALTEALCMADTNPGRFGEWFEDFLPGIAERRPGTLFVPAVVSDRSDGKIAHLDGLNLSRSWCWRRISMLLPERERQAARAAADNHLAAALPHISGDYMGEHWLATFALLALLVSPS